VIIYDNIAPVRCNVGSSTHIRI
ncbi:hypothetical protein BVRB_010940, partial [Beta vulgaris subsp. vulgaris]